MMMKRSNQKADPEPAISKGYNFIPQDDHFSCILKKIAALEKGYCLSWMELKTYFDK
jgi:hypothetical protein